MNNALTIRLLWAIVHRSDSSIWVQRILTYRIRDASIWTVPGNIGSWSWRKVLKLRSVILPAVVYDIGNGATFKLWLDPWFTGEILIRHAPTGPRRLGLPMESPLSAVITVETWNLPVSRGLAQLQLHDLPPIHGGCDVVRWRSNNGQFLTVEFLRPQREAVCSMRDPIAARCEVSVAEGRVEYNHINEL
ncbi:hypothetical protein Salat_0014600 [Sesamum alatum]|uniref:Reverse transcriptase zinc-binding domain-containing protein n=1 Tax=Sesamum alatum TaxID=300844 RepID=A0AAE1YVC1_9LAMI|nr:hypothetical protein Salat_0014600 [Sesamum alatum]